MTSAADILLICCSGAAIFLQVVDTLPTSLLNEAPIALQKLQAQGAIDTNLPFDLTSASAASVFASRLAFLSELRDYLTYVAQGAKDKAAQKLVGLLSSGIAPVGLWAVLLVESITLLEGEHIRRRKGFRERAGLKGNVADPDILFSTNDTFELMRVLQEVSSDARFNSTDFLGKLSAVIRRQSTTISGTAMTGKDKTNEEHAAAWRRLEEVRLALARNLARAMVAGFDASF